MPGRATSGSSKTCSSGQRRCATGTRIEVKDLFLSQGKKTATFEGLSGKTLEEIEKAAIYATLKSVSSNKTEAAKVLGIAYSTLYEKMKKYGIKE